MTILDESHPLHQNRIDVSVGVLRPALTLPFPLVLASLLLIYFFYNSVHEITIFCLHQHMTMLHRFLYIYSFFNYLLIDGYVVLKE